MSSKTDLLTKFPGESMFRFSLFLGAFNKRFLFVRNSKLVGQFRTRALKFLPCQT